MIWYDMIRYDMIYLLTAVGLTPVGSSTVHIYTQTVHRTINRTTKKRTIHRTTQKTIHRTTQNCNWNSAGHTDWLTWWSRVPLDNLTVPQLVKKSPSFYCNRKFIAVFTTADQFSYSTTRHKKLTAAFLQFIKSYIGNVSPFMASRKVGFVISQYGLKREMAHKF
jgi:hypothetical protein